MWTTFRGDAEGVGSGRLRMCRILKSHQPGGISPHRVPILAGAKLGRTSAPHCPHAWQVNRGSMSDKPDVIRALIVVEWLHLWSAQ
jgi:hypothetical protein